MPVHRSGGEPHFQSPCNAGPDEVFDTLIEKEAFKLERIVSRGHTTPVGQWYDQDRDEWVALLSGSATLRFEQPDEVVTLASGDWLVIPAHRRHRVEETARDRETVWVAVHFGR
ncbi:MAG: hypothetical protein M3552_03270 [Planctomycetota bacterium]|nr:hypothetical protein [Planctomycetaceae bacterium]MDQ3329664.1 hypothetical protein [Planctomycetota bacterium]